MLFCVASLPQRFYNKPGGTIHHVSLFVSEANLKCSGGHLSLMMLMMRLIQVSFLKYFLLSIVLPLCTIFLGEKNHNASVCSIRLHEHLWQGLKTVLPSVCLMKKVNNDESIDDDDYDDDNNEDDCLLLHYLIVCEVMDLTPQIMINLLYCTLFPSS